jgi:hypothetical protein
MIRKMVALLVSSAVLVGSMNAALAQAASSQPASTTSSTVQNGNSTPLPAGGAAGIRQAQGGGETAWHIVGLGFLGGVILAMIFVGNEEGPTEVPTTTSSN